MWVLFQCKLMLESGVLLKEHAARKDEVAVKEAGRLRLTDYSSTGSGSSRSQRHRGWTTQAS